MHRVGTLVLTHSSRKTNPARSSVQFLTGRFGAPDRLDNLPPLDSLKPPPPLYSGAISLHAVSADPSGSWTFHELGRVKRRSKIQHAAFLSERDLVVGYEHRIERWRLRASLATYSHLSAGDFELEMRREHPLLAGLHTVEPLPGGRVIAACAAPDALLIVDAETGGVETVLEMPAELYGESYDLGRHPDLRRHYIHDGLQRTHLNAGSIDRDGRRVVVSTFIQGAIGIFDLESGDYRELSRGFVGCHGARFSAAGQIYFADSVTGTLVFLDRDGRIERRFGVGSRWLHDVQQLDDSVYAFALADTNELLVYDIDTDELVHRRRFVTWPLDGFFPAAHRWPFWVGNSTQALSFTSFGKA